VTHEIIVTDKDFNRLQALIESSRWYRRFDQQHIDELEEELNQARVVPDAAVPGGVVQLYSIVCVTDLDNGKKCEYQLVLPKHADSARSMISVLAPIGTALLGYSVGAIIDWKVPAGKRRFRIDSVEHRTDALPSTTDLDTRVNEQAGNDVGLSSARRQDCG